jgi:hypothetical protein
MIAILPDPRPIPNFMAGVARPKPAEPKGCRVATDNFFYSIPETPAAVNNGQCTV